ncbi:haloacid dehalogenase [Thermogladius sp. 4427co]|uniref:haloacid dehalogenase n=1 Tax=Thermogladius sp. 4427co TaxID=3450718 RepID=UPI003F7951F5
MVVYISLEKDVNEAIEYFTVKDRVRELAIKSSREILRYATEATRLIHSGLLKEALENIVKAREEYVRILNELREHPDILYSGILQNSLIEYVEAYVTYYVIAEGRIPGRYEINVDYASYLLGLGDTIGELRRYALDLLLKNRLEEAERIIGVMNYIYDNLRKVNFPDALIPGLRHKVDTARRLIESTLELLIYARASKKVVEKLDG